MDPNVRATAEFAEDSGREDDDDDDDSRNHCSNGRSGSRSPLVALSTDEPAAGGLGRRSIAGIRHILHRFFRSRHRSSISSSYRVLRPHADHDFCNGASGFRLSDYADCFREMLLSSWLNGLLVFVPVGMVAYLMHWWPIAVFTLNAIAVIPLSALLTAATETVAGDAGDTIGALLNISLGNLVELILFIVALANKKIRVVQASILGSILVNSLLILGTALLATGLSDDEPMYNTTETQLLSSLLFASVFVFMIPTAFGYTFESTKGSAKAILQMSRLSSLMVLLIYLVYFVHELKARRSRDHDTASTDAECDVELLPAAAVHEPPPVSTSMPMLAPAAPVAAPDSALPPRTVHFADDNGRRSAHYSKTMDPAALNGGTMVSAPDAAESETETEPESRGRPRENSSPYRGSQPSAYLPFSRSPLSGARSVSAESSRGGSRPGMMRSGLAVLQIMRDNNLNSNLNNNSSSSSSSNMNSNSNSYGTGLDGHGRVSTSSTAALGEPGRRSHRQRAEFITAVVLLVATSALMSVSAEFLVDTIDAVTHQGHLSESVIGLVILPIVGNIAEYVTVVSVAVRDKLDLAIAVAIGSSIQIALCVAPLTVVAGWILRRDLSLFFSVFEMAALVGTALLVGLLVSSDSEGRLRTCSLKGALMCACYVIIAFGAYLSPNAKS